MTTDNALAQFYDDFDRDPDRPKPQAGDHPGIQRHRWGLFPDVDIEAYHRGYFASLEEGELSISQSGMGRLINETPLDYAFNDLQLNPDAERLKATVQMHRGDVVHQLSLGKGRGYAIAPAAFGDWKKKAAQDFKAEAIKNGQTPILAHAFEEAEIIAEVIRERIDELLDGAAYDTEVAFLYQETTSVGPVWVRGMLDVWCPERRAILDPKITPQLYDAKIGRHMVNMGWDRQAALYPRAVGMILGGEFAGRTAFRDVMVKPEAPFTSRVVKLDKADEYQATRECVAAIELFGQCVYSGRWPGFEGEDTIELPIFTRKSREALGYGEV
jgi:hypothetical protein